MKTINRIVVHSTGTDTKKKVKDFFTEKGVPLFHYIIARDGEVSQLCFEPWSLNHDEGSIHIAYIGGINRSGNPLDNRSPLQQEALFYKLVEFSSRYDDLKIIGAEDSKTNPAFDVGEWRKNYEPNFSLDKEQMSIAA